jgi:porin
MSAALRPQKGTVKMQRAMLCAWGAIVFLQINLVSRAENLPQEHAALSPPHLGVHIPADGVEFVFGSTNIYQQNVNGGMSTHRRAGRLSGSYDIEVIADLRRLLGLEGARVYVHTEGGYSKSGGINDVAAGSAFGVNGDAFGRDAIVVTELYFEQSLADDTFILRAGKMDLTGGFECLGCLVAFDTNHYAHDETRQFLNAALVNNPTIPFPDYALGISAIYTPIKGWYASAGVVDAENDFRETGFRTAFHGDSAYFYVFETGILPRIDSPNGPMPGGYRLGFWVDGSRKSRFSNGDQFRNDTGIYISADQMLYKENAAEDDYQGLGAFFRWGWADSDLNAVSNFFSLGLQYEGLFEGRDTDALGIGMAHGTFSDHANANDGQPFTEDHEMAWELYYRAELTPWLGVTPSVQYIKNPGGIDENRDAVVLGLRVQATF